MLPKLNNFRLIGDTFTLRELLGLTYSSGQIGGTAAVTANPARVDAFDALFYQHDLALQEAHTPVESVHADVAVGRRCDQPL